MAKPAILFDLDGTLLDTLGDIGNAMNRVLTRHGLPTFDREHYRLRVGLGIRVLVERSVPPEYSDEETIDRLTSEMKEEYTRRPTDATYAYDGIEEMLENLVARGVPLGVLSNKVHSLTRSIVEQLLGSISFVHVQGALPDVPHKPDPTAALMVAEAMGVAPRECLFIGDTAYDMETARAAGMSPIGVSWGFRSVEELKEAGAERIVYRAEEVLDLVEHWEAGVAREEKR